MAQQGDTEIDFDNPILFNSAFPRFVDLVGCSTLDSGSSRTVLGKMLDSHRLLS